MVSGLFVTLSHSLWAQERPQYPQTILWLVTLSWSTLKIVLSPRTINWRSMTVKNNTEIQHPKQSSHDCPQNLTAGREKTRNRERERVRVWHSEDKWKCKRVVQAVRRRKNGGRDENEHLRTSQAAASRMLWEENDWISLWTEIGKLKKTLY